MADFDAAGAQVFGISVDTPYCHDQWRDALDLPESLILLSDFNREFGTAYDLLFTTAAGFHGALRRTVFVIDRDGTITYRWDTPQGGGLPDPEVVLAEVRKLTPGSVER
jgi:peroxiredoxin